MYLLCLHCMHHRLVTQAYCELIDRTGTDCGQSWSCCSWPTLFVKQLTKNIFIPVCIRTLGNGKQTLTAHCRGLPGWSGTARNLHPLTPIKKKEEDSHSHKQQGLCLGAHPLYGVLCRRGLFTKLSQHRAKVCQCWLQLTASAFNWLSISMPAILVTLPTCPSLINFFHYCLPSSGFCDEEKDNRGRCTNNLLSGHHPIRTIGAPISIVPHFYAKCPFYHNPPNGTK